MSHVTFFLLYVNLSTGAEPLYGTDSRQSGRCRRFSVTACSVHFVRTKSQLNRVPESGACAVVVRGMCGRTACTLAPDEVSRACVYRDRRGHRRQPRWKDGDREKYRPSYNKSPQSMSPVLVSQRHFDESAPADECVLASMRWGLIPSWFKENDPSKMQYSTSNCRSENILQKKSYKDPLLKGQRCVILADGFYEWQKLEKNKQPFFIYFPQTRTPDQDPEDHQTKSVEGAPPEWTGWKLLTMAGLFDCWTPPDGGEALYSYSIITVNASPNLQSIHNRMPAVLDGEEEVRRWLDFGKVKSLDAMSLLQSKNILTFHPVSSVVNNSRNNNPECLQPLDLNSKKEPRPTASSRMMTSWLSSGSPSKSKEAGVSERKEDGKAKKKRESSGTLQQWLQKKARTK
ncbi:abasic site processing protein HMCES isoform X1 [Oryzias melastigma]|nr:abasic site processing protein HMCES isoform X1 [Oryzias melastigma]